MTVIPTMRLRWVARSVPGSPPGATIYYGGPPTWHTVQVLQQWFDNPSGTGFWQDVATEAEERAR